MNIWRRGGSVMQNPYERTAFRIARVPAETVRYKTIVQLIGQTRRVVRAGAGVHAVKGRPVTDAELNAAEKVLLDAETRIAEELLHHRAEPPPARALDSLLRKVRNPAGEGMETGETEAPSWLKSWVEEAARRVPDAPSSPCPFFGPDELTLVPPFGDGETEDAHG